jgi:uncharacterized protein (TIGR00251 family)
VFDIDRDGNVVLTVHVQPGARRSEVVGLHGSALKVRVTAPAQGGKANEAVVTLLAATLDVSPGDVELIAGASSRRKRLRIAGRSRTETAAALGLEAPEPPLSSGND